MKIKRNYEDLKGTEKECFEILSCDQIAVDNNTEWCLAFWLHKIEYIHSKNDFANIIRKYPPESLTKYRRNLIFDGLIHPTEESKKHSIEMELSNHQPVRSQLFDLEARETVNKINGEKI